MSSLPAPPATLFPALDLGVMPSFDHLAPVDPLAIAERAGDAQQRTYNLLVLRALGFKG